MLCSERSPTSSDRLNSITSAINNATTSARLKTLVDSASHEIGTGISNHDWTIGHLKAELLKAKQDGDKPIRFRYGKESMKYTWKKPNPPGGQSCSQSEDAANSRVVLFTDLFAAVALHGGITKVCDELSVCSV